MLKSYLSFRKFENYFGTFRFEFLGPGSFSKIEKSTFCLFQRNFHCTAKHKLIICHVLLKS